MCSKKITYFIKWIIGFVMTVIGIGVIMSVFFSGGSSEADVEMQGEDNKSVIQQSNGFHVLELNNSGDSGGCQGWTWTEYALVILGFIFILKISHLLHYCFVTKAIIKRKVSKIEMEMKDLGKVPPNDVIIVPRI
jgi:hypothetical protein